MIHLLKKTVVLFVCLMPLSCVSTASVEGPRLDRPDSRLLADCELPVLIPSKITNAQLERLWGNDRAALLKCGWNKKAVQDFYLNRDNALKRK